MKQYLNSFGARQTLVVGAKSYAYYSLAAAEKNGLPSISRSSRSRSASLMVRIRPSYP